MNDLRFSLLVIRNRRRNRPPNSRLSVREARSTHFVAHFVPSLRRLHLVELLRRPPDQAHLMYAQLHRSTRAATRTVDDYEILSPRKPLSSPLSSTGSGISHHANVNATDSLLESPLEVTTYFRTGDLPSPLHMAAQHVTSQSSLVKWVMMSARVTRSSILCSRALTIWQALLVRT